MSGDSREVLRLGTRGSLLARAQSGLMARALEQLHPGLSVELVILQTTGDRITDQPLHAYGGKGLFTKEIELALLAGSIDVAVHSFKDVPVTMPLVEQAELIVAAVPRREDPRDALVSSGAKSIAELPKGARVGTGSLRRRSQLLAARPDLRIEPIRGNIDTRLRKCGSGEYDAIVLAMAGLHRGGLFDPSSMSPIDPADLLPAAGQGALALQCRRDDARARRRLSPLNDATAQDCVSLEREVVRLLEGDCHSPIAALAERSSGGMTLRVSVGARDGNPPILKISCGPGATSPETLARAAVRQLIEQGAMDLLHGARP